MQLLISNERAERYPPDETIPTSTALLQHKVKTFTKNLKNTTKDK